MNDIDFERAAILMDIQAKAVNIAPMCSAILGEAQAELKEIEAAARENAIERAEAARAEEARRMEEKLQRKKTDEAGAVKPREPEPVEEDYIPNNGRRA